MKSLYNASLQQKKFYYLIFLPAHLSIAIDFRQIDLKFKSIKRATTKGVNLWTTPKFGIKTQLIYKWSHKTPTLLFLL